MAKNKLLELLNDMDEEEDIPSSPHDRILFVDGLNLFFRNFAMMNMVNEEGIHIGGLGGFLRSLGTLINVIEPTSVYIIFDGENSTMNRKNILQEYKEGRHITRITNWDIFEDVEEEHESKLNQLTRLIDYLKCLPVKTLALDKVEADDIIAYLSKSITNTKKESKAFIVSSDKDFIQLVTNKICVYRPMEKVFYTPSKVLDTFGVIPENFLLYKVLMGDASDKLQGIKGLGPTKFKKYFSDLKEKPFSFEELIEYSGKRHKDHILYSKVVFEENDLKKKYQVMDLHNPMLDDVEKKYLEDQIDLPPPKLNSKLFLQLYKEDGLRHLIKNLEFWVNNQFESLNKHWNDVK